MESWREELYRNELYHHGIQGQKWGRKNGPPYPLDYGDHSAAEKKHLTAKDKIKGGLKQVFSKPKVSQIATGAVGAAITASTKIAKGANKAADTVAAGTGKAANTMAKGVSKAGEKVQEKINNDEKISVEEYGEKLKKNGFRQVNNSNFYEKVTDNGIGILMDLDNLSRDDFGSKVNTHVRVNKINAV